MKQEPDASELYLTDQMDAEDYAAQWGCDPIYDQPPRQPGDGYMFYNFAVEDTEDFLERFIPAIERTIRSTTNTLDRAALEKLKEEVQHRLVMIRREEE
jgi:hypothetical protein